MIFIETNHFSKRLFNYLDDEKYAKLQEYLSDYPDAGDLISGGGGLRKIRWMIDGRGKRGGLRIIYYWFVTEDEILFLELYTKNEKSNLSTEEIKQFKHIVEGLKYG